MTEHNWHLSDSPFTLSTMNLTGYVRTLSRRYIMFITVIAFHLNVYFNRCLTAWLLHASECNFRCSREHFMWFLQPIKRNRYILTSKTINQTFRLRWRNRIANGNGNAQLKWWSHYFLKNNNYNFNKIIICYILKHVIKSMMRDIIQKINPAMFSIISVDYKGFAWIRLGYLTN